jgi:hypothetical protein
VKEEILIFILFQSDPANNLSLVGSYVSYDYANEVMKELKNDKPLFKFWIEDQFIIQENENRMVLRKSPKLDSKVFK